MSTSRNTSGRFITKKTSTRASNLNPPIKQTCDPPILETVETVPILVNEDHTYTLPLQRDSVNENNVDSEIEIITHTEEDTLYEHDDVPSDLLPLSHCRFIVDLGFMAEQLKECRKCYSCLHLHDSLGVRPLGFAGLLYVNCSGCGNVAKIKLGKTHYSSINRKGMGAFDINTKAATGMLHAGIGETQLNNLLSTMNVHPIDHKSLKVREHEVGHILEGQVEASENKFLLEEAIQSLNIDADSEERHGITVSTDTGWQKKGSGRAYNSLSGVSTMIGKRTGGVVKHAMRCQQCRICESAYKRGVLPKKHNCKKNWTGSAKAMEPDMLVQMVTDVKKKGVDICELAGDDDTVGYERVKKLYPDAKIIKTSDKNHVKKNIVKRLYTIKNQHKQLSEMVINSIMKNFSFMTQQNQGNPEGIENGLKAMIKHMYGEHDQCSVSWCGFLRNKSSYHHTNLPHDKDLTSSPLRAALEKLFVGQDSIKPLKLAKLSSSQANENLNNMIAQKAPKAKHYSSSASLGYRTDATILQKNEGYNYISEVHEAIGLSPGKETIKRGLKLNTKRAKTKDKAETKEAKKRRLHLKQSQSSKNSSREIREGKTYESEIGFVDEITNEEIPGMEDKTRIPINTEDLPVAPIVVFDLETTSLSRTSDIIQLAATSQHKTFNRYIFPSQPISREAADITKIFVNGNQMFYNNDPVEYKLPHEALTDFIEFLSDFSKKCVLVGHNIKRFDCHILHKQLHFHKMWNEFCLHVCAFLDSLELFKSVFPGLPSYSQTSLVKELLDQSYNAHNAIDDTNLLYQLVSEKGNLQLQLEKFCFPVSYPLDFQVIAENMSTFSAAIERKAISKTCALKAARSNLKWSHLKLSYERDGIDGLRALLSERSISGTVRVTKCKRVVQKLFDFFNEE